MGRPSGHIGRGRALVASLSLIALQSTAGQRIKTKCTTSKDRRVRRWEKEDVLERVQARLDANPAQLAVRSMTVEHP
ncbi:hypothetical protein AB9F26_22195, partial [Falsihalocynthiibacter sp. BN13B15]